MLSNDIADYPIASPFLASLETEVDIAGGTTKSAHFILERLAARIDVTLTFLKNGVAQTPSSLIAQPEVRIFSCKKKSYLFPATAQSVSEIAQATVVQPPLTSNDTNLTFTYYTYETSELDIAPLFFKVLYYGSGGIWEQNLVIKDGDGNPVIRRNHYYSQDIRLVIP